MTGPSLLEAREEVELLGEELVVVCEVVAKEREGFGEGSAPEDHFGPPAADAVECCEALVDANGVVA